MIKGLAAAAVLVGVLSVTAIAGAQEAAEFPLCDERAMDASTLEDVTGQARPDGRVWYRVLQVTRSAGVVLTDEATVADLMDYQMVVATPADERLWAYVSGVLCGRTPVPDEQASAPEPAVSARPAGGMVRLYIPAWGTSVTVRRAVVTDEECKKFFCEEHK